MVDPIANEWWQQTLKELRFVLPRLTFDSLLLRSQPVAYEKEEVVIAVINPYAVAWLESRLMETVLRFLRPISGSSDITVRFVSANDRPARSKQRSSLADPERNSAAIDSHGAPVSPQSAEPAQVDNVFPGFDLQRQRWFKCPLPILDLWRQELPTIVALVNAILGHTLGDIINKRSGQSRDWWIATNRQVMHASGIRSPSSLRRARYYSVTKGYFLCEPIIHQGRRSYRYRLRRVGEPLSRPVDKKPRR